MEVTSEIQPFCEEDGNRLRMVWASIESIESLLSCDLDVTCSE
jgi:hypothetical protein